MTGPQAILVSSGDAPAGADKALAHVLARLAGEAARPCRDPDVAGRSAEHGPFSAVVRQRRSRGDGAGGRGRDPRAPPASCGSTARR